MFPYLIYTLVLILLYRKAKGSKWYRLIMFLVTIFFIGFRKDVGTDYENYTDYFNSYADFFEIGYSALALFIKTHGYDVTYLFFIMAALSYGIIYFAVEFNDDIEKGTTSLLICLLTITFSVNGIRQFLAAALFMLAYCFIKKRNLILFLVCIGAGVLFHKSILILTPFYFLGNRYLPSKYYIVIYLVSFILTTMSLEEIMKPFAEFLSENEEKYYKYIRDDYNTGYFSLGVFVELLNYIILLFVSIKLDLYKKFPLIFNLFFTMCVVYNLRIASPIFNRIQVYFIMFTYYLLPLAIKRLNNRTSQILTIYYVVSLGSMAIKYIFFTPNSRMAIYHDVFGIF